MQVLTPNCYYVLKESWSLFRAWLPVLPPRLTCSRRGSQGLGVGGRGLTRPPQVGLCRARAGSQAGEAEHALRNSATPLLGSNITLDVGIILFDCMQLHRPRTRCIVPMSGWHSKRTQVLKIDSTVGGMVSPGKEPAGQQAHAQVGGEGANGASGSGVRRARRVHLSEFQVMALLIQLDTHMTA